MEPIIPKNWPGYSLKSLRVTKPGELRLSRGFIVSVLLCVVWSSFASRSEAASVYRPAIGLALSGGGARGGAHVGVLKILEKLRIPIDYIAGTSMGAIVGGLYASGMSPEELERVLTEMDWEDVFKDRAPRAERSMRRKQDDISFLVKKKPRIQDRKIKLGPAAILGQKFDLKLRELTLPVSDIHNFDHLRIPFRAVATDVATGHDVIMDSGNLARSIRASMAVPVAFAPVEIDGRSLVDGGIAKNIPISVVRDMGADVVIAVDISSPLRSSDEVKYLDALEMLEQLTTLMTWRGTEQELSTLTNKDILIRPELGDISSMDFDRVAEAIEIGFKNAKSREAKLGSLSLAPRTYATYSAAHKAPGKHELTIDFIRIENDSRLGDKVIARHLGLKPGQPLETKKLEAAVGRVYGLDIFESVSYEVTEKGDETGVVVTAKERTWGTNSLQFGLEMSTTQDESLFNLGAAYTVIPLNRLNGEWRISAKVGEEPSLITDIYQPLDPGGRWFVEAGLGYVTDNVKQYEDLNDPPRLEYDLNRFGGVLGFGRNLGTSASLAAFYRRFEGDADVMTGDQSEQGFDFDIGDVQLLTRWDTLDNPYFPRSGYRGLLGWRISRESLGADTDFDQIDFHGLGARSWDDHTLIGSVIYRTSLDDDVPIQSMYRLGGFLRLSGFNQRQLAGQHAGLAGIAYLKRLGTKLVTTYLGASLELGNAWQNSNDIAFDNTFLAGSLFFGADTVLGPVYLAYGHAEGGHQALYLFLGTPWRF